MLLIYYLTICTLYFHFSCDHLLPLHTTPILFRCSVCSLSQCIVKKATTKLIPLKLATAAEAASAVKVHYTVIGFRKWTVGPAVKYISWQFFLFVCSNVRFNVIVKPFKICFRAAVFRYQPACTHQLLSVVTCNVPQAADRSQWRCGSAFAFLAH